MIDFKQQSIFNVLIVWHFLKRPSLFNKLLSMKNKLWLLNTYLSQDIKLSIKLFLWVKEKLILDSNTLVKINFWGYNYLIAYLHK